MATSDERISNFMFEVGSLKNIPRTGWLKAGIKFPETIAEHSMRTALLGWVIAAMEGADTSKVVKMCLMHDLAESRIGDFDKVARRYLEKHDAELKAQLDIAKNLPDGMDDEASELYRELFEMRTKEANITRDADRLEMFIQAHEYENAGHSKKILKPWKESGSKNLKTKSAKRICKAISGSNFSNWWSFLYNKQS